MGRKRIKRSVLWEKYFIKKKKIIMGFNVSLVLALEQGIICKVDSLNPGVRSK